VCRCRRLPLISSSPSLATHGANSCYTFDRETLLHRALPLRPPKKTTLNSMGTTSKRHPSKGQNLNLRIKPDLRGLIERASGLSGKTRNDFVLDAARVAAENALLDRTVVLVNPKAYAEFVARLDAPPRPNARLRKSLQTPAPRERC